MQGASDYVFHAHALSFAGWDARKTLMRMAIPFARRLTTQAARKASARKGSAKFARLLCRSPCEYATAIRRGSLLAIITNLAATRCMKDIIRGSLVRVKLRLGNLHL